MRMMFVLLGVMTLAVSQPSLANADTEAVRVATAYMMTITHESGLFGPVPRPELRQMSTVSRVSYFGNADPDPTYLVVFGVRFDSPYDDGCDLVVLVSAKTGQVVDKARLPGAFPGLSSYDQMRTSKYWHCWLGNDHPSG